MSYKRLNKISLQKKASGIVHATLFSSADIDRLKWPSAGLQCVNEVRYWKSFQLLFSQDLDVSTAAQLACGYSALRIQCS